MKRNDVSTIKGLSDQLGYPVETSDLLERFEELVKLPHHALFVVDDGEVQGWIHLEVVHDLIEEKKVEIKALVVNESSRGKGFGKQLVEEARRWAKTIGVSKMYLSCNIIRERAHAFYLREGFSNIKTSHFFETEI